MSDQSCSGPPATSTPGLFAAGLVAVAAISGAGCPAPAPPPRPPPTPIETKPPTQDVDVEVDPVALTGTRFIPEAVPPPSMVLVRPRRRVTLDRQRRAWPRTLRDARTPIATKQVDAQILATLLYQEADADPGARAQLLGEARTVVDQVIAAAPDQADPTSLHMAASLAVVVGDDAASIPVLRDLVTRFPDRRDTAALRAQLAFQLLRTGQDDAAAQAVDGLAPDASPELAYVTAWLRFRAGDRTGAVAAMSTAAATWTADAYREPLVRDTLLMVSRAATPADQAAAAVGKLVRVEDEVAARNLRYALLYMLSKAYGFAGQPDLGSQAIDLALAEIGSAAQPTDVPVYRLEQAEYARRAGRIGDVAAAWMAARAALDECKACPKTSWSHFATGLAAWAVEMHTVYATTGDARYHDAARALYELYASLPEQPDAERVSQYARDFASTRPPDTAARYGDGLAAPLASHLQEIQACYEQVLQGTADLAGTVTLRLEVDQGGAVTGATTEPPGGDAGLAAVGRCVEERARAWPLPSRTLAGVARVTAIYKLAPAGPAAAD